MNISLSYNKAILELEVHKKKTATLSEYYNCIKYIYKFLEKNCTDYFNTGTRLLVDTDLNDLSKY